MQRLIGKHMQSLRELSADNIISILLSGIIAGIVTLISSVSFAALIFNGALTPYSLRNHHSHRHCSSGRVTVQPVERRPTRGGIAR